MTVQVSITKEELDVLGPPKPRIRQLSRQKLKQAGYFPPEIAKRATLAFYRSLHRQLLYLQWNGRIIPRDYDLDIVWDSAGLGIKQVVFDRSSGLSEAVTEHTTILGEVFRLVD